MSKGQICAEATTVHHVIAVATITKADQLFMCLGVKENEKRRIRRKKVKNYEIEEQYHAFI